MEHPILFSSDMVKAILEGRKTQTRRVLKSNFGSEYVNCPYGKPGDFLWVRETWRPEELESGLDVIRYKADGKICVIENTQAAADAWCGANNNQDLWIKNLWKPSIFMPRWTSRITLEIVNVRVERVQEITRNDAKAEGVKNLWIWDGTGPEYLFARAVLNPYIANFSLLWDKINAKRGYGWDVNPFVWVIEFKVAEVKHATEN